MAARFSAPASRRPGARSELGSTRWWSSDRQRAPKARIYPKEFIMSKHVKPTPLALPVNGGVAVGSLAQARRHKRRFDGVITIEDPN